MERKNYEKTTEDLLVPVGSLFSVTGLLMRYILSNAAVVTFIVQSVPLFNSVTFIVHVLILTEFLIKYLVVFIRVCF